MSGRAQSRPNERNANQPTSRLRSRGQQQQINSRNEKSSVWSSAVETY